MKTNESKVSRATVYNTLDLLQECGIISRYRFGENHSRYEKAIGRPHHDHLICLECGDIIEFVNQKLLKIQKMFVKKIILNQLIPLCKFLENVTNVRQKIKKYIYT